MANDVVPMPKMFKACRDVLGRMLIPLRYDELTMMALSELGLSKSTIHWQRQIEDVREKMLMAGRYGSFYIGAPHCLAGLKWWFKSSQERLIHPTPGILISSSATAGANGAFEALMRNPYLLKKTSASDERIMEARAKGMILQSHITDWFQQKYPGFYRPPDNEGRWQIPCDHDFKLCIDGQIFKFDVSGPHLNGRYGNPGNGKKATRFHLLGEIANEGVWLKTVIRGSDYGSIIFPDFEGVWPERLIVWLNCKRERLDYNVIKEQLWRSDVKH